MDTLLIFGGFDPSSFAGISADIITSFSHGVHPLAMITANTVQVSGSFKKTLKIDHVFISDQFDLLMEKYNPSVIKSGMLADIKTAELLQEKVRQYSLKLILDPVVKATAGKDLVSNETLYFMIDSLIKEAFLVTPNIPESLKLLHTEISEPGCLAEEFYLKFKVPVFLKGGHLESSATVVRDFLVSKESKRVFTHKKIMNIDSHGSGCRLATSIAANISKGLLLEEACEKSLEWINKSFNNPYDLSDSKVLSFGENYFYFLP